MLEYAQPGHCFAAHLRAAVGPLVLEEAASASCPASPIWKGPQDIRCCICACSTEWDLASPREGQPGLSNPGRTPANSAQTVAGKAFEP